MFVNISNHPSSKWSKEQKEAAGGEILDIPFPNIDPKASTWEVEAMASEFLSKIPKEAKIVLVQGEQSFSWYLIFMLKSNNRPVKVVVATTERRVIEKEGGVKESVFEFVQFREI